MAIAVLVVDLITANRIELFNNRAQANTNRSGARAERSIIELSRLFDYQTIKINQSNLGGKFPPRSKDFFFASCGSLFPFTRANWGLSSTLIYTSELILCSTICVPSATRHNIHMYPYYKNTLGNTRYERCGTGLTQSVSMEDGAPGNGILLDDIPQFSEPRVLPKIFEGTQ